MKGQFLLFVYVPYNKTKQFLIYRKFQLVDLEGSRLVPPPPPRITYVLLKEGDYVGVIPSIHIVGPNIES